MTSFPGMMSDFLALPMVHAVTLGSLEVVMKCRGRCFLLAVVFLAGIAQAQIPVTDDAFTSSAAPNANYGVSLGLVVQSPTASGSMSSPAEAAGYTANTYLKFDLSALPPNVTATNLAKANLRLYVDFVVSPGKFDVYLASGSWSEATLTASNAPGRIGAPVTSGVSVTNALKYVDVDITPAFANGSPANGLVLVPSPGSNIFVSFDSKENPLTAHDPQLSVSVNDASSAQLQLEITRATQAENTISTNLANEVVRAQGAENALSTSIGTESTQRVGADNTLQANITALQNSLSGYAQIGTSNKFSASQTINGDLAVNNVNAAGLLTANGALIPAVQQATPTQGYPSNPFDIAASVSDGTNPFNETFRWVATPVGNGTQSHAAQLKLQYGGGTTPSNTGLSIDANGIFTFAPGQTVPGAFSAGGDLAGSSTVQTVKQLQGVPLSLIGTGQLSPGSVIAYNGSVLLPTPGFSPGADLTGTATAQTVSKLQGQPLSLSGSTAPGPGSVLSYNGNSWVPSPGFAPGGDLGGTATAQRVNSLQGVPLAVGATGGLSPGQVLGFNGAAIVGATIPAGPAGPQGPKGDTGPQGPVGPMPVGAALTGISNNFTASQTISGSLNITGSGNGITFPDGTTQTTATASGQAMLSRALFSAFLPGPANTSYTASAFVANQPITITRVVFNEKTPQGFCDANPSALRVTNGISSQDIPLIGNRANFAFDSGPMVMKSDQGSQISIEMRAPVNVCGHPAADINVQVEYKAQDPTEPDSCAARTTSCSNNCVFLGGGDAENCGACGNACGGQGGVCAFSKCVVCGPDPSSGNPLTACKGFCVDTSSDAANCGSCGNVCPSGVNGLVCSNGQCLTPSGGQCSTGTQCASGLCQQDGTCQ